MKNFKEKINGLLPYIVAAIVFILLAVVYCKPMISGKVLSQGDTNQWKGMSQEIMAYHDKTGEWANWTNSMFSGMPSYQIAGGQPSNGFTKVVNAIWGFLNGLTHLFFNSILAIIIGYFIGFFILMRSFNINKWLSIVGSIAVTMSSYFFIIIVAGHNTKAETLGMMAPVIAGFFLIFRKKYGWGISLVMLYSALGMMRHPQMSYYMFMMMGIFGIAEIYIHIKEKKIKDLLIGIVLFAASLGVGVGSGYSTLKSNSEYMKETMRGGHSELVKEGDIQNQNADSGLSLEYATQWSYGIDETLTLLIPNYMGGSSNYNIGENSALCRDMIKRGAPKSTAVNVASSLPMYWGEQPFTSGPVYVGAIICFLFVLGVCIVKGPYKWALLISTMFSIFLSWGHNMMWLTELFYKWFPYYDKFRTVSSILVVAEIAMPLLAFLAIKTIMDGDVSKKKIVRGLEISAGITGGICLIFALFGSSICSFTSSSDGYYFQNMPEWLGAGILSERAAMLRSDALRSLLFIVLAAALVWGYSKEKIKFKYFVMILGVLVVLDMWPVNKRFFNDDNFVSKRENVGIFQKMPYEEALLADPDPHFRVLNTTTNTFNESRTSYYFKSIGGYHAAKLRRYQDLIDEHISKYNMNVLNMLNTKYLIISTQEGVQPQFNPDHLGNGWFVDTLAIVNTPNEESDALKSINPAVKAVTDVKFKDFAVNPITAYDSTAVIALTSYAPDVLEYTSHSRYDKTAVFSEIYYPYGWKAYIDGQQVEHFRVNYVLRAMNIPAGDHTIRFEFRPDSIYKGYVVSTGFGAIIILFLIGAVWSGIGKTGKKS
ncbi:MAG: YfhO family protein [Bacteroidales bacterium]|nr:YfhO family protein [Bacteroidales bacterium]MDD4669655.1 YfhO family protein [Bacteroidales bacterium]